MSAIRCSETWLRAALVADLNRAQDVSAVAFCSVLRELCKLHGGINQVAKRAGMNSAALRQSKNLTIGKLHPILKALDLKLLVVPRAK